MRNVLRGPGRVLAALVVLTLAGCGPATTVAPPAPRSGDRVAFFLPHAGADRYEAMDEPYFTLRLQALCRTCQVDYYNAGNKQDVQNQQAQEALDKGAKVLVIDAVDSKNSAGVVAMAQRRRVPVISYDRLILGAALDYYVSFDAVHVGRMQAQALLDALGPAAAGSRILWVNGPPNDFNAVLFKQGAHEVLDGKVTVAAEFTMPGPGYDAKAVDAWLRPVLPRLGATRIAGVYSVDDVSAGVVGAALTAAGVATLPPITGQNADIAGMQRMLVGKQYMTAYKPIPREAEQAAELAYALLRGQPPTAPARVDNQNGQQPAFLLEPKLVKRENLRETVLSDGFVTVEALCAAAYTEACKQAGIA
jgi:D-xylose transport system substrate-binding protein